MFSIVDDNSYNKICYQSLMTIVITQYPPPVPQTVVTFKTNCCPPRHISVFLKNNKMTWTFFLRLFQSQTTLFPSYF